MSHSADARLSDRDLYELNKKAVTQNFSLEPRLTYNTVNAINGPLVILEIGRAHV